MIKRTKTWLSLLLVVIVLFNVFATMSTNSVLAESCITNLSDTSGSKFTNITKLATVLNSVFSGDIDIYSNDGCTNEILMPLGTSMSTSTRYYVKSKTTGNNASGKQCYIYANAVYNKLFNEWVGHGTSFSHSEKVISGGSNTASYSMFSSAGVRCGAYMRTTNYSSGAFNGNSGHSLIVLSYNSSTITYLEGNADGKGLICITNETWDEFNKGELSGRSRYISHIVQPTKAKYDELYPSCAHTYDGVGICSKCNYQFPYDNDRNTSYAGTYKVKSGATAYIRKGPYQKCTEVTHTTSGTFTVLARVLNCKGNYWYELSYNNSTCYVVADNLEPSHVHTYSLGYESAHPHKQYKKCSCGYYEYTGSTQKVSGCTACYPVSSYGSTNPDDYTYPDPNTTDTIYRTSPTMKGSTVAWVQAVLFQLGYSIEVDGSFGQNSEAVVKQFQSDNGLEVDGRVGPATKRKLLERWNEKKHTHSYSVYAESSHPHKEYNKCTCGDVQYTGQVYASWENTGYESAHPHKGYRICWCGYKEYTGEYQTVHTCDSCLPEKSVLTVVPGTGTEQTTFTWQAASGADCYELKIFEAGNDTPLHWLFNLTTTQYELLLPPGDYVGYVVSLNIDLIDTSNYFVYSDKVEFSVLEDEVLIPFASVEYNGNRYELFDVTMSWTEAKSKCAELGGHLVTISSEEEMDKIMSIVSLGEMATYWIGYSDEDTEDYWCSVTGEEITYTNWDVGQPDDYNNAEDYALIKNQPNGKWNDVKNEYSDVSVGFICEYEGDGGEDVVEPSTGNEDEPIAPTEPSTNDEDKPTESTDDEYKPTQPANPSTGDEDKPTNPVVTGLLGDANEDGKVNIKDATLIQKSIANLTTLTDNGESLADADLNTKINIKDATAIQKHIAGIETGFPIGEPLVSKENN